jgi:hypothetical protein
MFIVKCDLNLMECKNCKTLHYLSYYVIAKTSEKIFYPYDYNKKFFQFTKETVIELVLMEQLMADIMFKQSSFRNFAAAYTFRRRKDFPERQTLNAKRLADIFYCYEILKFYYENNLKDRIKSIFFNI